jgi:serine/threonine protein kinase
MQQCFEITPSIFVAALDLCDGGTLDQCIQQHGPIPEPLAKRWMFQILKSELTVSASGSEG